MKQSFNKKDGGYFKIGKAYSIKNKKYIPHKNDIYLEKGTASWYGDKFQNKLTANGEIFNKNIFTAAHKTLPLPSVIKVTNISNNKSILVRVNDRGPFCDHRIIDVSEAVAKELEFYNEGVSDVYVQYMKKHTEKMLSTDLRYKKRYNMYLNNLKEINYLNHKVFLVSSVSLNSKKNAEQIVAKLKKIGSKYFRITIAYSRKGYSINIFCKKESMAYFISHKISKYFNIDTNIKINRRNVI